MHIHKKDRQTSRTYTRIYTHTRAHLTQRDEFQNSDDDDSNDGEDDNGDNNDDDMMMMARQGF